MTHASNKVEWCLRKAREEKEQEKKHRGLVKINPDVEEARKHIEKAEHNLRAISYFSVGGFSDWSMSAAFYCIYHCFLAISINLGYESRNQECTIALIKYLKEKEEIEIEDRFISALEIYDEQGRHESNIIEKRELFTYGTTVSADNSEIEKNVQLCKDCLYQTKKIIFK
ncbi:HEPN domain-containing protein [Candidatus Pacearchaeota archaeon]|nr:HEPN domain-containing protein [Candidatus Pacearchaeota archaeon]